MAALPTKRMGLGGSPGESGREDLSLRKLSLGIGRSGQVIAHQTGGTGPRIASNGCLRMVDVCKNNASSCWTRKVKLSNE